MLINSKSKFVLFEEKQKFNHVWLWVLLITVFIFQLYSIFQPVFIGKSAIESNVAKYVFLMFYIAIMYFFYIMQLTTIIDHDAIHIRFYPFHLKFKTIARKEIKHCYIRKYKPIREYGGWGLRFGTNGTAYNVKGNMGLQLELTNGKKLLIGTSRYKELDNFLKMWAK
jgi:hypothetical protein